MIQAILFDLDGTLIDNKAETFLPAYFKLTAGYFASLIPSEKFVTALRVATTYTVQNAGGSQTNMQKFQSVFCPKVGMTWDALTPHFDRFYAEEFPKLQAVTAVIPEARPAVKAAFAAGKRVIIATNPLFPQTAIEQRLSWAGVPVSDYPYELVTTLENMHSTKPQPLYYREIAELIGFSPSACLMVGDDKINDIGAAQAGMKTFLVCDPDEGLDVETDYCGSLSLLTSLLQAGEL